MQRLGIFVIHGVGDQRPGFSAGLQASLRTNFRKALGYMGLAGVPGADDALDVREGLWAHLLEEIESDLWRRMDAALPTDAIGNPVRHFIWKQVRQFLLSYAADAIAYSTQGAKDSRYHAIPDELRRQLVGLAVLPTGAAAARPLTVVAHSLGGVIASDFFYDLRRDGTLAGTLGLRLDNVFTLGNPQAIYAIRTGIGGFHPRGVDDREHGMWVNIYDPDDVLGLPLKPLNAHCDRVVHADLPVEVGSLRGDIPHAAHMLYWEDRKIGKLLAEKLAIDWLRISGFETAEKSRERIAAYRARYAMPAGNGEGRSPNDEGQRTKDK